MAEIVAKTRWSLTDEAFGLLLDKLDADRERAGAKYEIWRRKLVSLFVWEQCASPEDLADETFNRLAKKLTDGEQIREIERYLYGVARLILFEDRKRQRREQRAFEQLSAQTSNTSEESEDDERTLVCVRQCLENLEPEQRTLILAYYAGDHRARIENRQKLAQELNISPDVLRKRVFRLRGKLEVCAKKCLNRKKIARDALNISDTNV